MPAIRLSLRERSLLSRLARAPLSASEVDREHVRKFIDLGLAVKQALLVRITPKGQLEVLRQRFRRLPTKKSVRTSEYDFISKFEKAIRNRRMRPLLDARDSSSRP